MLLMKQGRDPRGKRSTVAHYGEEFEVCTYFQPITWKLVMYCLVHKERKEEYERTNARRASEDATTSLTNGE
jgi:hypothetical protein